jgi:D-sedoheptulose 7-phosphate isomerase
MIMLTPSQLLERNLEDSIAAKKIFLAKGSELETFEQAVRMLVNAYEKGGRLYIAGNGGSAADAQHLAAEFVSKLARDRAPLAAEALTVDSSILTAIGNDYGYEKVFSRQVAGKMTQKDVFLGITTSGKSPNIILALQECRARGIKTIVLTGHDGGTVKDLADFTIIATGSKTSTIQEIHIVLAHTLCESVENSLFN